MPRISAYKLMDDERVSLNAQYRGLAPVHEAIPFNDAWDCWANMMGAIPVIGAHTPNLSWIHKPGEGCRSFL